MEKNYLNFSEKSESWQWFMDLKEIEPGKSAILGGNKVLFYILHCTGLFVISLSLISCACVIIDVIRNSRKTHKWDFSDRFPLYLAISDLVWAISNLSGDHVVLMTKQVFPDKSVATALAINVAFFFGYQQLMSAGLSLYTYLRVVRRISVDFGKWEWKLQAFVVLFLLGNTGLFLYLDAYGNSGYWFMVNMRVFWGKILAIHVCTISTIHAFLTYAAYRSIQKVICKQKRVVSVVIPSSSTIEVKPLSPTRITPDTKFLQPKANTQNLEREKYHMTAANCLTTFVLISLMLYFPMAVMCWAFAIIGIFDKIEILTSFSIIILANSGGWVNTFGYFHNKRIKNARKVSLNNCKSAICSITSSNSAV